MRRRTLVILAVFAVPLSISAQLLVNDVLLTRCHRQYRHYSGYFPSAWRDGMEVTPNPWRRGFGYEQFNMLIWDQSREDYIKSCVDGPLDPPPKEQNGWLYESLPTVPLNRLSQVLDDLNIAAPPAIVLETRIGWPALAYRSLRHRSRDPSGQVRVYDSPTIKLPVLRNESPLVPVYPGAIINGLAYWLAVFLLLAAPLQLSLVTTRGLRMYRGRCPKCAYDLRGDRDAGCPECGWNRDNEPPAQAGGPEYADE